MGKEAFALDQLESVQAVQFRSDESLFVLQAGRCQLWDMNSGTSEEVWRDARQEAGDLAVAPNLTTLAISSGRSIHLLDLSSQSVRHVLRPPFNAIPSHLAFSPDGRMVAAGLNSDDQRQHYIGVWGTQSGKRLRIYGEIPENWICRLRFHPDGQAIVVTTDDTIRIYDLGCEEEADGYVPPEVQFARGIRFSPDGTTFDAIEMRGKWVRIDSRTGLLQASQNPPDGFTIEEAALGPSGTIAAGATRQGILLWHISRES
jgi:WD40 repeat protein